MSDLANQSGDQGLTDLSIDPDVLERELAAELLGDPLDELDFRKTTDEEVVVARDCDVGLQQLKGSHDEQLQGLRVFCEHRDARAVALLLPLLDASCPVVRMSACMPLVETLPQRRWSPC